MVFLLFLLTLMNEHLSLWIFGLLWNNTLPECSPREADFGRYNHRISSIYNNLRAKN